MLIRAEMGVPVESMLILSIGDLNRNKNHQVLIQALSLLPDKYHLAIAGDGPLRAKLERLTRELSVVGRVHFLGFRHDINSLLNAADLFCFPSLREGLPVSLIEACATATPCISSKVRGCADVLGRRGVFVGNPRSATEWARIIEAMGPRVGVNWPSPSMEKFSLLTLTEEYKGIYELACCRLV